MFSDKLKHVGARMLLAGSVIAAGLVLAGTAQAQSVVVRSTGPSQAQYPAGKKLAAETQITLKASDQVTVLDKAGTRVLSGPGSFTLDGRVVRDGGGTQIAGFLSNRSNTRARTGAVRGAGASPALSSSKPTSPNLWFVDVSKPGKYCVVGTDNVILWRPNVEDDVAAQMTMAGSGQSGEVMWKRGSALKLWPQETLPVSSGASYSLNMPGAASATSIALTVLDVAPSDPDEIAATLIANGCDAQLNLLVDTMIATDAATPPASAAL